MPALNRYVLHHSTVVLRRTCTGADLDSNGPTCLALLCPHQVILWAKNSEDYNIANGDSTGDSNISGISEL